MRGTILTVAEVARNLGGNRPAPYGLSLAFTGLRLDVKTNSLTLLRHLADYFRGFEAAGGPAEITVTALEGPPLHPDLPLTLKEPDPGKDKIKEEYLDLADGRLVRKRLTGMVFVFGAARHLALGPCQANPNQVVNFVNNRHLQWMLDQGGLLFHAAGVSQGARGLALCGRSGMGKSTLALHLMSDGLGLISNDRLVVDRLPGGLRLRGVAKLPRINPGTALANPDLAGVIPPEERERFARLPPDELWDLEHKYDVPVDECFGPGRFSLEGDLAGLVILNWARGAGPALPRRITLAQRPELLPAFMKERGAFYLDGDEGLALGAPPEPADYLALLGGLPVLEIAGGVDFPAAVAACQALLAGEAPAC
ncbi:MAG: HprK-related kinase B [Deltaproteobacteria bacterium]|nr:HprK-related kinase B [Deltaproteobacteria bacterium]